MEVMTINPNKFYNASEIARLGVLDLKDRRSVRDVLKKRGKRFHVVITGHKEGTSYSIKGQHLLKLVNELEFSTE
jgi:hypothetical protein